MTGGLSSWGGTTGDVAGRADGDPAWAELECRGTERAGAAPLSECSEFIEALRSSGGVPTRKSRPWDGLREGSRGWAETEEARRDAGCSGSDAALRRRDLMAMGTRPSWSHDVALSRDAVWTILRLYIAKNPADHRVSSEWLVDGGSIQVSALMLRTSRGPLQYRCPISDHRRMPQSLHAPSVPLRADGSHEALRETSSISAPTVPTGNSYPETALAEMALLAGVTPLSPSLSLAVRNLLAARQLLAQPAEHGALAGTWQNLAGHR